MYSINHYSSRCNVRYPRGILDSISCSPIYGGWSGGLFEVGAIPISEKMGRRIILKICVWVVLRCISVPFFDLQPLKIPNFLCSRLRRSRVTLWPTYLEREQNNAFMSPFVWRHVCFEVLWPFYWHFEVFCLWITAPKTKISFARFSRAREVFRWPNLAGDVQEQVFREQLCLSLC